MASRACGPRSWSWNFAIRGAALRHLGRTLVLALLTVAAPPSLAEQNAGSTTSGLALPQTDWATPAKPTQPVVVVLTAFDNTTNDSVFDHSMRQALFLEMSQSPRLTVLSEPRVADTPGSLGRPVNGPIPRSLVRDVCLRTGSQYVLEGAIAAADGHYQIDLKASDCKVDAPAAEQLAQASSQGSVLRALHSASSKLRVGLGESLASVQKFGVSAEATTASLEALEDYSLGLAARRESGDIPSIPFFKRALVHDPGFPMAKAQLAVIYGNLRQPSVAIRWAADAYELRKRVGERERFHIAGVFFLETGQMDQEILNYERWQTQYPGDPAPYNNLGNAYAALGRLNQSLAEYRGELRLAPSVVSYTNVAGMELALNRFSEAESTLDEAFASKLDGRYLHQTLYWLAFLQGNAAQMAEQVAWTAGRPGDEDPLLSMDSDTEAYHGRLSKARQLTSRAVDSALRAGSKESASLWQVNDALRDAEVGSALLARRSVDAALALSRGRDVRLMAAFALARAGYGAEAARLASAVASDYPTDSLLRLYWLPTIRAAIKLSDRDGSGALKELRPAASYELGGAATFINYLYPAYVRGLIYLQMGRAHEASVEFQKVLDHRGIVVNFVTGALAHLQLGRACAMAGDGANAKAAYQDFFDVWTSADPDVPLLLQAKREYARL